MPSIALSNYQLGDLLGRGASGNVYRGLNFLTGETVAIKSISVSSLPASSLPDIMSEIDLLKNLNHPNIVKYKGFAREKETLFIVLEYCENGSLQSILKRFGKFPESLVAVYMRQVLEGLVYLHEQGVIHRDIKGANILTNKDGSVKLADFGVSSRAPTPDLAAAAANPDADNEVVGSPYWMAPEVIEQSGATSASDVWSVGCVVVELLEGKPPFGDLTPMQALWRIVQDESMRIPEGASPIVRDFLYQCFQKDPNLRVSAKKLLRHAWMQSIKRSGDAAATVGSMRLPKSKAAREAATPARPVANGAPAQAEAGFAQAIQRVQEWNEALNAAPKNTGTIRRIPAPPKKQPETKHDRADVAIPPASAKQPNPVPSTPAGGLLQKNQHVSDALSRARESDEAERWDDDFASDISLPRLARKTSPALEEAEPNHATVRPSKESLASGKQPPLPTPSSSRPRKPPVEDYSDLGVGEDDLAFKLSNMKACARLAYADPQLQNKGRIRIMHPDDLRKVGSLKPPAPPKHTKPTPQQSLPPTPPPTLPPTRAPATVPPKRPQLQPQQSSTSLTTAADPPSVPGKTPPGSRQSSLRGRNPSENNLELLKYTEADNEDYSDMFDGPVISSDGANTIQSLQLTRRSNRSWQEEEEEDDVDPFAELEDDFGTDSYEENLKRDRRAASQANVERLIAQLDANLYPNALRRVAEELLSLMESAPPDMQLERHFVQNRGMLALLEVLETNRRESGREMPVSLLKIVNFIVAVDVENLESFCLVGGIPVMIPYSSKKYHVDIRLEASAFIQHLTRSPLTLQMFISCRGLKVLVELLDEDYSVNQALILSALEGIGSVFDLQSPTPKPDFCRMFTREGILDPLSTALLAVIKDKETDEEVTRRCLDVLLLFSQVAQADSHVRASFATRTIMMRLLKALDLLPRKLLVTAIKAVKHLATHPQLIEVLQNSNAVEILVFLLGKSLKGSYSNEICSHVFQTIYSMCRLSKSRQEEAAAAGIIPLLKRTIASKSQLKQFALPVLCDLANAGKQSRRLLWQNEGMNMYLQLLDDPYWRVSALEAVTAWMQDETARVELVLLGKDPLDSLTKCFVQSSSQSYERILDPYLKILRMSPALTKALVSPVFLKRLAETLERQTKAMITLNLLRITRVMLESHPDRAALVPHFNFDAIVSRLASQNDPVLVRELAQQVYPVLVVESEHATQHPVPSAMAPAPKRRVSAVRRKSNDAAQARRASSAEVRRSVLGPPPGDIQLTSTSDPTDSSRIPRPAASGLTASSSDPAPRQKRAIARSNLKDVQWEPGENGRLVRSNSRLRAPARGAE